MERKIRPVPKPESTKKSKAKGTGKTVNTAAVDEKRRQQNNINRNFGKSVEHQVAKLVGGTRVPMSGAVKNSVHNLEGDVSVRTRDGKKVLSLIECKGTAGINPQGEKTFNFKFSIMEQAIKEAALQKALPVLWIHPKGEKYEDDYCVIPSSLILEVYDILRDRYDLEISQQGESE